MDRDEAMTKGAEPRVREEQQALARLETLAHWLDRRHLDPILGLFLPGIGDSLPALLGLYGVYVAYKLGGAPILLARMLLNLGLDALVGGIPVLGVFFDFFYRAHLRNLDLLKQRDAPQQTQTGDWLVVGGAALAFLVALALPFLLLATLLTTIWAVLHP